MVISRWDPELSLSRTAREGKCATELLPNNERTVNDSQKAPKTGGPPTRDPG